jgi:hypothetical protein
MQPDPNLSVTPLGLALTLVAGIMLVVFPRRYAIAPIVMMCCYMTMGQAFVVAGCHFTMIRVVMLFGWTRVLVRGEIRRIELNHLDRMVLWWIVVSCVAYIALWRTSDAFIYKIGGAYNVVGFYFLFRLLLRNTDDVRQVFRIVAILIAPLAGLMLLEKSTGHNLFSIFGGVSDITAVRDGVLRCTGPFAHPILAGTFGATVAPFFIVLWSKDKIDRVLCTIGMASSLIIATTSGSSGPVLALLAGTLALCLWPARRNMHVLRRGLVIGLICLQFFMKVPVWFLLARVDVFSGSTGFHRSMLIDSAIRSLGDWWLIGTKSTEGWADEDQGLFDVTNQYIHEGAEGGLASMLLFIWIIVWGFRFVGLTMRAIEAASDPATAQFLLWALGASLFAHVVSYISVSYFDQNFVNWYLLLAMLATAADQYLLSAHPERVDSTIESDVHHPAFSEASSATSCRSFNLHIPEWKGQFSW